MAKARVDLKGITKQVDRITKQLEVLQEKSATQASKSELSALQRKLVKVRSLVSDECPPGMFRSFDLGGTTTARRARKRIARKK